jgi:nucleotide-binding universal stress UspA family protein
MENHSVTYLVLVDFTPAAESATRFAIDLAKTSNAEIILLHIIKAERERREAELAIKEFAEKHASGHAKLQSKVVEGNLTEEIEQVTKIMDVDLIIMGTHCITGLGKVFRSHAFKIVEDVSVPLIIVQKETEFKAIKKIVMTIDLERESIQIVSMAAKISKLFNSEIILVAMEQTEAEFKQKVNVNMIVCQKILREKNIDHKIIFTERKDFVGNIFKICQEENADLLAATYYQQHVHIFTESFVQTLAYNDFHIPLLTMDEEATHSGGQFGAMFG